MAYFRCTTGGSGKGNTLVVTCADDLAGATITCTNGTKTYRKTCPSTSPYEVTFYGLEADTWTVSATVSGNTYTTTVVVVDCAALLGGFNWRTWVDTAQFLDSTDYNSLDEVLADEEAVRELCLEHNCVDYLADIASANEDVETIINNDLFAKWVNNSDYSLDALGANVVIKALMDEADKYGYGEWCLMPQVPTMTSTTAPYGTVRASHESTWNNYVHYAWRAFNGAGYAEADSWGLYNVLDAWIEYESPNPYIAKRFGIMATNIVEFNTETEFHVYGSNDGSNYTLLRSITGADAKLTNDKMYYYELNNDTAYKIYRLRVVNGFYYSSAYNTTFALIDVIQFYSYAPKGNVPIMTDYTLPYGQVLESGHTGNDSLGWRAFDRKTGADDAWYHNTNNIYIGYKFINPICVKRIYIQQEWNTPAYFTTYKVQASNTGDSNDWTDLATFTETSTQPGEEYVHTIENNTFYLYYRVFFASAVSVQRLQFYGREFKVSVPKMTSNTTPIGEVVYDHQTGGSTYAAYMCFDKDYTDRWYTYGSDTDAGRSMSDELKYIGYGFAKPVAINALCYRMVSVYDTHEYHTCTLSIDASDDGNIWESIYSYEQVVNASMVEKDIVIPFNNSAAHKYWRVSTLTGNGVGYLGNNPGYYLSFWSVDFYAFDYSEKEFEAGSTKKWLYDHGLELVEFENSFGTRGGSITKEPNQVVVYDGTRDGYDNHAMLLSKEAINLTDYSLAVLTWGDDFVGYGTSGAYYGDHGGIIVYSVKPLSSDWRTNQTATSGDQLPLDSMTFALDISAINDAEYIAFGLTYWANLHSSCKELWLE